MNVLGIDTSSAATAVCVERGDGRAFELRPGPGDLRQPPGHTAELMPAIHALMGAAELAFGDLDLIAVGTGPGGFTGLRIGIATASGLALASDLPVRPVSSLAALAAGAGAELVMPVADARRGELFVALYQGLRERWSPFVARPEELAERLRAAGAKWSTGPLAVGDGSLRFREVLESVDVEVPPDESPLHAVRALQVCRLAAGVAALSPEAVSPTYLRAPDARPAR